jgi:hypothetical protein
MDDADVASNKSQQRNDDLINNIRIKAASNLKFAKVCYYCDTDLVSPKIFCDADCRNDYDREKKMAAMKGSRH